MATQGHLDVPAERGCHSAQGHHLARPAPAALVTSVVLGRVALPAPRGPVRS